MRERRLSFQFHSVCLRITPAYAGKTAFRNVTRRSFWDHPRVCGKDPQNGSLTSKVLGSPPRMRERPRGPGQSHYVFGITPAYAGKTPNQSTPFIRFKDHPRVCGKDTAAGKWTRFKTGSPPRMRERPPL